MGFAKLREWVGTVTGKGVRWGRDSVGRSAPAFMAASTPALPPLTCMASRRHQAAVVFAAKPANCGPFVGCEACAGRRIRWLCCLQCLFCGLCLPCHLCLPCPLPSSVLAPVQFALCFATFILLAPCSCHVRQDHRLLGPAVCQLQDCPVGSCNTGLQWRPVRRVHLTLTFSFSCRVHDPGPWVSVNYNVKLSV